MADYTTGPWRAEYTNGAKLSYVVVSAVQGSNGNTVVIGQCAGPDKEANARLIAAAPDILEALKSLTDYAESANDPDWFPEEAERITVARAAIAKAEGRPS